MSGLQLSGSYRSFLEATSIPSRWTSSSSRASMLACLYICGHGIACARRSYDLTISVHLWSMWRSILAHSTSIRNVLSTKCGSPEISWVRIGRTNGLILHARARIPHVESIILRRAPQISLAEFRCVVLFPIYTYGQTALTISFDDTYAARVSCQVHTFFDR